MPSETAATQRRALTLFLEALELGEDRRDAWLAEQVAQDAALGDAVRRLAAEDGRRSAGDETLFHQPLEPSASTDLLGEVLGSYRLVDVLGIGGMSVVYLGERVDDFEQRVAVKVVRRDVDEAWNLEHLARERQILARLNHPNIARLLDGGRAPGGAPYLVIEIVDGEPITAYVRRHGLVLDEVLRLFLDVCAAVAAAHDALLVHGDLKPGNVLVTADGTVKLLDFGVARMLGDEPVGHAARAMTPGYASPEQLRHGTLTVASDVYSLGVVLYQLLTGRLPTPPAATSDASAHAGVVEETRIPAPSGLAAAGRPAAAPRHGPEVDAVVLRALAPSPGERYRNVGELAEDCRRLLEDRPVRALPRRWTYLARKLVARHRLAVAAAILALAALSATAGIALFQAQQARREAHESDRQREIAELQRQRAESVTGFLRGLFDAANVESDEAISRNVRVVDVLDRAAASLQADRTLAPETRLDLLLTLVGLEQSLHRYEVARALAHSALTELESIVPRAPLREGKVYRALGLVETAAGDFAAAEAAYRRVFASIDSAPDRVPRAVELAAESYEAGGYGKLETAARLELAGVYMYQGRFADAVPLIEPVLAERPRMTSKQGLVDVAQAASQLAECAAQEGDLERAWALLVQARDLMREGAGARSAATATVLSNLGQEARLQGRCDRAVEPLEEALSIRVELGVDERDNLRLRGSLAFCLAEMGRREPARLQLASAMAAAESLPDRHFKKTGGYVIIGRTLGLLGRAEEAAPYLEKSLAWQRQATPGGPYVATLEYFLAENLVDRGRLEEGARELEPLMAVLVERHGPEDRVVERAARTLARAYDGLGRSEAAAALRSRFPAIAER